MIHPKYKPSKLSEDILRDWLTGKYSREGLAKKYRVGLRMVAGLTSKKRQHFYVKKEYRL